MQNPQETIEQQSNVIAQLKVRIFDAEEQAKNLDTTLNQFAGEVARRLDLEGEQANDLREHLKAIDILVGNQAKDEAEAEA